MSNATLKGFIIILLVCAGLIWSAVSLNSTFSMSDVADKLHSDDTTRVKETVIEYCLAAKANDREQILTLITWTPEYYWNRTQDAGSLGQSEKNTKVIGNGLPATRPEDNSDFAEWSYRHLIEHKPLASKGLIVPEAGKMEVRINGDYAIVRTLLRSANSFSVWQDFLLAKENENWKIFKITPSHNSQTFPFKDRPAFTDPLVLD